MNIAERMQHTGFKIVWRTLETNQCGESQKPMSYATAEAWRDEMNAKYKGVVHHWIEPWVEPAAEEQQE